MGILQYVCYCAVRLWIGVGGLWFLAKIKVCVRSRGKHGFYISSVPVNQISELAKFRKRR